ncbi:MAG: septum formation protein Maf [Chloroflexi bacterium]|nr:septum formation protein Maf [Chloroflexota bacterium]
MELLLASQSPRRRELIKLLGYPFQAISADVDESLATNPDPALNVVETAQLKAAAIAERMRGQPEYEEAVIVAADTTVALDGRMLGKPADAAEARQMLSALRNRSHEVHTGAMLLELATGRAVSGTHTAIVTMRDYSDAEIETYVATGDPLDKAGAYAIQHPAFRPAAHLDGCFTGVMGLSVCHLLQLFHQLDAPMKADLTAVLRAHQQYPCATLYSIGHFAQSRLFDGEPER